MFAIIISEKGGPERREAYDKSEINVGRVQGNDLMLPKGNVSKHHARLLFRDGRFIVTDLKSTNGTYVNGKKIAQATVVREGDKIFIGDFVIRLEGAQEAAPPPIPDAGSANDDSTLAREAGPPPIPMPAIVQPSVMPRPLVNGPAVTLKASTHPPGARPVAGRAEAPVVQPAEEADDSEIHKPRAPALPPRQATMPLNQAAPLQPLMRGASGGPPPLPSEIHAGPSAPPAQHAPPALPPQQASPQPAQSPSAPIAPIAPMGRRNSAPPPPARAEAVPSRAPQAPPREAPAPSHSPAPPLAPFAPLVPFGGPANARDSGLREPPAPAPAVARAAPLKTAPPATPGKTDALVALGARVGQAFDLAQLRGPGKVPDPVAKRVESVAREQARAMSSEGALPPNVEADGLARDLVSELIGLGPVTAMFEDDDIVEIHAQRFDRVLVARGDTTAPADVGFSSDEGLVRILQRLCDLSGEAQRDGECVVERRLPNGATVFGVLPPVSKNAILSVRKRRVLEVSFEHLTRQNTLSRPMAVYLEAMVTGKLNTLVIGPGASDLASFVAAFVHAAAPQDRVAVVEDHEELTAAQACVASFRRGDGPEAVTAAARTRPDRLVVTRLGGGALAATFDAMSEGCEGVVAGFSAGSLRSGLSRLASQLVFQRPGLMAEGARELVAESFDSVVELGVSSDGRRRVLRIVELGTDAKGFSTKDVFAFNEADGSFSATGITPKAAAELGSRGVRIDASIFKRSGK